MKKAFYVILSVLTVIYWLITPLYFFIVALLRWRAFVVFPLLAGLLAWLIIRLDGGTERSLADLIQQKIKNRRIKKIILSLFRGGRVPAIIISILFFGPFLTPLVANSCIRGRKVYVWAVIFNMAGAALGVYIYQQFGEAVLKILFQH